jgi:hypothetical protein
MLTPSAPFHPAAHAAQAALTAETLIGGHHVGQPVLFEELDSSVQRAVLQYLCDDSVPCEWTEDDVVQLHWLLLKQAVSLDDPATPLADKFDTLRWIFSSPDKEHMPFSFANCVRVVGTSPLSPTPYFGLVDVEAVRDWIRANARRWVLDSVHLLPAWVQELILARPDWVDWLAERLDKNPQWINEQVRKLHATSQLDMFQSAQAA